jgi:hypothetical protein
MFLAILPLALDLYGMQPSVLWRTVSATGLIVGLLVGVGIARRQLALSPDDRAAVGTVHTLVAWGLFTLAAVLLGGNSLGVFGAPSAAPYVTALVCSLGVATSNFVTIAFQRLL